MWSGEERPWENKTYCYAQAILDSYGSTSFYARANNHFGIDGSSNNVKNDNGGWYDTRNVWDIQLGYWEGWVGHDANGNRYFQAHSDFDVWGQGQLWDVDYIAADAGVWLPNYDRSPTQPSISASRASDGASFTIGYSGGVNNSGPGVSYTLQYYDNTWRAMSLSGSTFYAPDPTQAYYFRVIASNTDGEKTTQIGPYYGVPSAPTSFTATRSSTVAGRIDLSWGVPTNTQAGITGYDIYRNGSYLNSVASNVYSYPSSGLTRNTSYDHYVVAKTGVGYNNSPSYSRTGTISLTAPGVPTGPSVVNTPTRSGRNVTVTAPKDANGYNNAVTAYRIQYATSDDSYATWYGWNGTSGVLNDSNVMDISGSNASFYYSMLTAAKTYKFRVFATNSTGTGDPATDSTVLATPYFLPASGKHWNGTSWEPTAVAKRWNGSYWADISTAKRYSTAGAATTGSGTTGNVVSSKGYYTRLSHTWSYNSATEMLTISGEYILGAGSTYFSGYQLSGSLVVNNQAIWSPSGNYSINANSEITLTTFNLVIPKASILYSSIPITSSIQMTQQGLAWSLPLIASSLTPQVINGTWVELT